MFIDLDTMKALRRSEGRNSTWRVLVSSHSALRTAQAKKKVSSAINMFPLRGKPEADNLALSDDLLHPAIFRQV